MRTRIHPRILLFAFCWLVAILSLDVALAAAQPGRSSGPKPNIVVIVADDLGYADLGCQGGRDIPTPNIDSIATKGARFTSGYVTCPVCSPTRAALMTGRYQQRFGHEFNPGPPVEVSSEFGLPLTEITLAERLKAAGYATGMVGKWHLGLNEKFHPLRRGFGEYFGFLHGSHSYVDAAADSRNPILRGMDKVDEKEYLTDAFTREALAYIDRHHQEPFFLYLTYNAVHGPMQAAQKYLDRFAHIADSKRRTYAAMLSALDDGVGAVLDKLRKAGVEATTLVFFVSDNGGPTRVNTSRNDPFSGLKGQVLEGGIRVPFLVQWPARLPAGKVLPHPVSLLDILPTALAAAGAKPPDDRLIDGVSLIPYLTGKTDKVPHEALFWRYGMQSAVRHGNWKLVRQSGEPPALYDLAVDAGEKVNKAEQKPDVVGKLEALWKKWDAQLVPPLWGGRRR